ncbi:MAG: PIN domain-containing protein, partial [Nanoarchaeota archaeon]
MKLVLDNNSLFAIMSPESASSYLFSSIRAKFLAPEFIISELDKYKELCLQKSKLSEHEFEMRQAEVEESIKFFTSSEYVNFLEKSAELISDPNDIDFLALALSKNAAIWSNDPHLREQSLVNVYTTEDLLKMFLNDEI